MPSVRRPRPHARWSLPFRGRTFLLLFTLPNCCCFLAGQGHPRGGHCHQGRQPAALPGVQVRSRQLLVVLPIWFALCRLHGQAKASRAAELCVDRLLHQRVRPLQASTSTRRSVTRRRATKHVFSMNTPCTRRSTFLGSGAYAGTWTGGNNATFEGMRWSLPAVFGAGLAGIPLGKWSISSAALLPLSLQPCFSLLALHQSSSSVRRCAAMC